ncbi:MAG: endonuclease III [Marinifilaceae bacterium]|jgi:endonuclease-3|nr:endonuclease III [Marinifilaceae bacterium]
MLLKDRYNNIVNWFLENMPEPKTELNYSNPYELLVAVILSAQCTDKRVNQITPDLFRKYPDPFALSLASVDEILFYIRSCSYPNNKAKHLAGMSKILVEEFDSIVPDNISDLQKLPGVGRKTANVIVSVIFDKPAMAVDTHVYRVAQRIGLTKKDCSVLETEKQLVKNIKAELLPRAHHWLILHGRYICMARKPKCEKCGITEYCKFFSKL